MKALARVLILAALTWVTEACTRTHIVALVILFPLGTGCFVVRGERRIKPDEPRDIVKKSTDSRGDLIYYRHFDTPDFNLNVGVVNNAPAKWELQFLFNILPCYVYRVKETTWPLIAVI